MLTVMIRKSFITEQKNIFDTNFDMLSDMDFILKFSKNYDFGSIQQPIAIYRQHENQLQNKNMDKQINQMSKWYEKIKLSGEFFPETLGKLKLFLMLILPEKIFSRIISLR